MEGNEDMEDRIEEQPVENTESIKQDEIIISKDNISKEILWRDSKAFYVWLDDGQVREEPYCWFCPLCDYAVEPESVFRGMLCPGCNRRTTFRPRGKPIPLDDLKAGVIRLPDHVELVGDLGTLLQDTRAFIHRWVDVPAHFEWISAYYVALSYCYDLLRADLPYLRALGEPGTGKTRYLRVMEICYRSIVLGAASPPAIRRVSNDWRGTLVLDEGDSLHSEEWSAYAKILNNGNTPGRPVCVCYKDDPRRRVFYNVYGPKVLATRRGFHDPAIESRCLTIHMEESPRLDMLNLLPPKFVEESDRLMARWLGWRLLAAPILTPLSQEECGGWRVERRIKQILAPLVWIMRSNQDALEELRSLALELQKENLSRRVETWHGLVAECLWELYQQGQREVKASDVSGWVRENRGVELKPNQVGRICSELGIPSKRRRERALSDEIIGRLEQRYGLGVTDQDLGGVTDVTVSPLRSKTTGVTDVTDVTVPIAHTVAEHPVETQSDVTDVTVKGPTAHRAEKKEENDGGGGGMCPNRTVSNRVTVTPVIQECSTTTVTPLGSLRSLDELNEDYVLRLIGVEQKHHGVSRIPAMLIANRVWNFLRENGCDVEHFPVWQRVKGICERSPLIGLSSETSGDEDCWVRSDGVRPEWDSEKRNDEE